jgi:hypothetical protein
MTNTETIRQCAELAAIYWNSATLQKNYTIEEYIILTMEDMAKTGYNTL